MIDVKERPQPVQDEIIVMIHFVGGDSFKQPFRVEHADRVQDFMDWYREPGKESVWSWHVVTEQQIHMFRHDHIIAVDISGYIDPDGRPSRWYERIVDRLRAWRIRNV